MKMKREGSAEWKGGIRDGHGSLTTQSLVLDKTPYSFKTRFEEGIGTNPEELIAAAHAGCFSMAFALMLEQAGFKADYIRTVAEVFLEQDAQGFSIPAIHLDVKAKIPDIDQAAFERVANTAKENCPVSKLMKAKIAMKAELE